MASLTRSITSSRVGAPVGVAAMTGVKANRNTAAAIHMFLNMTAPTGDLFRLDDVSLRGRRQAALAPFHTFAQCDRRLLRPGMGIYDKSVMPGLRPPDRLNDQCAEQDQGNCVDCF